MRPGSRRNEGQRSQKMLNPSADGFTLMFDSQLINICENLKKIADGESSMVGIASQDNQHGQIVEKYNDFIKSLQDTNLYEERPARFQQLVSYLSVHFTFENTLMQLVGYPDCESHKKQHFGFINRINGFVREIQAGASSVDEMVLYIGHWLLGHALVADKDFGDFEATLTGLPIH